MNHIRKAIARTNFIKRSDKLKHEQEIRERQLQEISCDKNLGKTNYFKDKFLAYGCMSYHRSDNDECIESDEQNQENTDESAGKKVLPMENTPDDSIGVDAIPEDPDENTVSNINNRISPKEPSDQTLSQKGSEPTVSFLGSANVTIQQNSNVPDKSKISSMDVSSFTGNPPKQSRFRLFTKQEIEFDKKCLEDHLNKAKIQPISKTKDPSEVLYRRNNNDTMTINNFPEDFVKFYLDNDLFAEYVDIKLKFKKMADSNFDQFKIGMKGRRVETCCDYGNYDMSQSQLQSDEKLSSN